MDGLERAAACRAVVDAALLCFEVSSLSGRCSCGQEIGCHGRVWDIVMVAVVIDIQERGEVLNPPAAVPQPCTAASRKYIFELRVEQHTRALHLQTNVSTTSNVCNCIGASSA